MLLLKSHLLSANKIYTWKSANN
uniref:Uncharacterized protein n=1 Tax=Rhizophora mucronata TaxID=61149 RepID=A0A2P2JU75_RHIMU